MRNFNRGNNRFGGGRDFNRRYFGRRDSSNRFEMHRTTCSKCGNDCEVPFKPNGSKPVYCDKCFEANRNSDRSSDTRRFERPERGDVNRVSPEGQYKKQFESLNWKLDKILKILTPAAPVAEVVTEEEKPVEVVKPKSKKKKIAVKEEVVV